MRILRLLFFCLVLVGVVGMAGFVCAREALLLKSVYDLENAAVSLTRPGGRQQFWSQCKPFALPNEQVLEVSSIELAFINDREYQLQVICSQFQSQPVVMKKFTLPLFVTKQAGSAGLVASDTLPSAITVQLWGRFRTVALENQKLNSSWGQASVTSVLSPTTSCSGYGYQCCQEKTDLGIGQRVTTAIDCPQTCYSSCSARPIVLSFNTQPFYQLPDRAVTIASGAEVQFSYVVESHSADLETVEIDFGDGESQVSTAPTDIFSHKYTCSLPECTYLVSIQAMDQEKITSLSNTISQVRINVLNTP